MYTKISVSKPSGISAGSAAAKDPNVTIVDVEDILVFPKRDSKGIAMVGDFVLKPNARMIQIYMTKSKISTPYSSDGDEDSISIKQSFEGQHPGNKLEIREFIQNWLGKNVIVIHGSCAELEKEVVGTPCAPLQLKPEKQDNNDGRFHMLKFEAFAKSSYLPGQYLGTLPVDLPTAVADVTAIDMPAGSSQFKLAANTTGAAIGTDVVALEDKDHVTLIGSGGSDPADLTQGVAGTVTVVLRGGTTWVALDGASITLEYVNAGATKYLVELARN